MTLDAAKQLIIAHFLTQWALLSVTTPVTLENEDFDPEGDGGTEWVRVTVREQESRQRTLGKLGNRRFERLGNVMVQIFVKQGEGGTQRMDVLAHEVRVILEGTSLVTDVYFFTGRVISQTPDEHWHRVVVDVEFSYDETK